MIHLIALLLLLLPAQTEAVEINKSVMIPYCKVEAGRTDTIYKTPYNRCVNRPSTMPTLTHTPSPTKKPLIVRPVMADDHSSDTIKEKLRAATESAFGAEHVEALTNLVFKESSFNPYAVNKKSGACGLFQFYPCSKLKCELSDIDCQIQAGFSYVRGRYQNPQNAWNFHSEHGWY